MDVEDRLKIISFQLIVIVMFLGGILGTLLER